MTEFDSTLDHIGRYVGGLKWSDVDERAAAAVDHIYDSIGCMYGGLPTEAVSAARRLADATPCDAGTTVLGSRRPAAPECAVFANAAMVRAIDFNDSAAGPGGGHPSDAMPAVLAAAELHGASGEQFVLGVHALYEVFAAVASAVELRPRGWDHTLTTGVAAAAGACKTLGLSAEAVSNAVSMMFTSGLTFGVTRVGPLTQWKGVAAAHATMNGHLASRLAAIGITAPPHAVEGHKGYWEVTGTEFALPVLGQPVDRMSAAERSIFKLIAAEGTGLAVIELMLSLQHDGLRPEDVERIVVRTFDLCFTEIGGGQGDHEEKWDPKTRETADHSLPYAVAVALTDGYVGERSFSAERIADRSLRPLMNRIFVELDTSPAGSFGRLGTDWSGVPMHDIRVTLTDGSSRDFRVPLYAKGHSTNPAARADLEDKFYDQVKPFLGEEKSQALSETLWHLPEVNDLSDLLALLQTPVEVFV